MVGDKMSNRFLMFSMSSILIVYTWLYIYQEDFYMRMLGVNISSITVAGIGCYILIKTWLGVTGKEKRFWSLLAAGTFCFLIAQIIWFYHQFTSRMEVPFPNLADFFWLLQYSLFLWALIYKRMIIREISKVHSFFSIMIFMVTAATLSLHFLFNPILNSEDYSLIAFVIAIAYPTLDLGFLFATVSLYYKAHTSDNRKVTFLILAGFVVQIVADSIHIYYLTTDTYKQVSYIDPLWTVTLLLISLAGLYVQQHPISSSEEGKRNYTVENVVDSLPYVGVLILLFVLLFVQDKSVNVLKVGLFVVVLFMMMRQVYIIMAHRNLLRELKYKNVMLGKSEERYRQLVEVSPNAIVVEIKGRIVYMNRSGLEMLGAASSEEVVGKSVLDLVPESYHPVIKSQHREASPDKYVSEPYEFPIFRKDGTFIYIESSLTQINYNGEEAFLIVAQDITERKKIEERIKYLAYYDELTGLPNRANFHEQLNECINNAEQYKGLTAVMFIDLDRFKLINDSMGHVFGDLFLRNVAERLDGIMELRGKIFRLGGDEFCLILNNTYEEEASKVADRIIDELSLPFIIDKNEFFTSPSIGISMYPRDGQHPQDLVRLADIAMYNAKKQGGNNYQYYSKVLDEENSKKLKIEKELRRAIKKDQFVIHYQPKINLSNGDIVGLEALVRWQHPERGLVPPLEFIPIAEETGLIVPIGRWVLQEACSQMKQWHDEGLSHLNIAVNIAPRQFKDKHLFENVKQILQETGLEARYLEMEVTETVMQNIQETSILLRELKTLGVQISIDDFGTGYSSLSYLKYLPIDYLKIDKSFVNDITTNSKDKAIIQTIVDMGHHLKIAVVAEGIENNQQLESLIQLKCCVGQGYLFSKPLPANQVEQLFTHRFVVK
jgi:diguanylate cyclase (GGDEF)-like protein/PAS domain S-box-containing protein